MIRKRITPALSNPGKAEQDALGVYQRGQRLEVVERSIAELRPDPRNPRKHTRRQVQRIAQSIETFGFNVPILIDEKDQVIAGHGRLAACHLVGRPTVPVIQVSHLSEAQKRAYLIADNQLTDCSSWNEELLAQTLLELSREDLGFSIEATGFDMGEIDWRIAAIEEAPADDDSADLIPPIEDLVVSQPGDMWRLGEHRLLCGNALEPDALTRLLGDEHVRMLFTDPPYNVRIKGHASGLGAHQHREFAMASGEMTPAQFGEFMNAALLAATGRLVSGGMAFVTIDWAHVAAVLEAVNRSGGMLKNIVAWVKHNAGMGSLYRSGHELIVVSKYGTAPHVNNVELGRHGRHRTNVWRYPGANSFASRRGKEGDLLALHPTPKPVALVADALLDCSNRHDLVLDIFAGIGSTIIAAERVGRRCRAIEIDQHYVDATIRRFKQVTGQEAYHARTGMTFDAMAAQASQSGVAAP